MAYYDIDTENFARDNTPQFKRERYPALLRFIVGLLKPFTRLISILKVYKEGTTNLWSAGTYQQGEIVAYNGQVFEAINTTTATPDDTANWRLIMNNWRGAYEMQTWSSSIMILEYALNTYWGLTYSTTPLASDIYVVTNVIPTPVFAVSPDSLTSDTIGLVGGDSYVALTYSVSSTPKSFTIHVPLAWYLTLSTNPDEKIRAFADNYVCEGVTYSITTY